MIIRLDDDRDDDLMHDPTCNCSACARRHEAEAEEAEEIEALDDEHEGLDSNPRPMPPDCDWCGGKGCETCCNPSYAGVEP